MLQDIAIGHVFLYHCTIVRMFYWHCLHSMRSRLCVTVRCPSVVPIRPLQQCAAGLLLWARRVGDIDDCSTIGAAATRSSKCGQCHVYSWRRKLNTDLYCFRDSEVLVEKPGFFTFHPCLTPVNCDAAHNVSCEKTRTRDCWQLRLRCMFDELFGRAHHAV